MTDSLAQIRAERDADVALEAAHPDPLSIAGELRARAADRCARKRTLWTVDRYQGCPFMGCHDCRYKGGTDPNELAAQQDSNTQGGLTQRAKPAVVWEDGVTEERPRRVRQHSRGMAELDWSSTP